jgi:hypothetical protein
MLVADGRIALVGSRLVDWERGEKTARPISFSEQMPPQPAIGFPSSRWAHHNAIHVLSALDRRRKGFSRGKSLPDKYLQFGAATLDSSLKRQAVDGRVKPGQDENARERGLSAGSEKLTSITFPLRNAEAGAMILPVATKSPRLASRGEDGRGRGHLWRLRHGAAEERIFLVESVVTH